MQEITKEISEYNEPVYKKVFEIYAKEVLYRGNITLYFALFIILFPIGLVFTVNSFEKHNEPGIVGILLLLASFVMMYLHFSAKKRFVNSMMKQAKTYFKPGIFVMNEKGINESKEDSRIFVNWYMFSYYFKKDGILFLCEKNNFRFFDLSIYTIDEQDLLLKWVKSEVPPKQLLDVAVAKTENTLLRTPDKKSGIVIVLIFLLFMVSVTVSYFRVTSNKLEGVWENKTDSTGVILTLNDDETGKIELNAGGKDYIQSIINYNVQRDKKGLTLYITYGERKDYPEFFYEFVRFDVAKVTSDSLLVVGLSRDRKSTWELNFKSK